MKLAMRVGNYYRLKQIQPRHFDDLARNCRYPPEELRGSLMELTQVLPDEAAALGASLRGLTAAGETLGILVDAVDRQCREVLSRLAAASAPEVGTR
jgi:hypothetical protein